VTGGRLGEVSQFVLAQLLTGMRYRPREVLTEQRNKFGMTQLFAPELNVFLEVTFLRAENDASIPFPKFVEDTHFHVHRRWCT
jgi:hypothetical protein